MRLLLLWLYIVLLGIGHAKAQNINLQEGDLLFKQEQDDRFSQAIAVATISAHDFSFTHVGIAHAEGNEWYVLEATTKGVLMTSLKDFMNDEALVVAGRLRHKYQGCIGSAIDSIKSKIGKGYDHYFSATNDAYYCSELVQQFFIYHGHPLFPAIRMTFKDSKTLSYPSFWVEHFEALGCPIPEGDWGSNPGQLSQSKHLQLLGVFRL